MRGARTIRRGEEGWPLVLDLLSDAPAFLRVRGELPLAGAPAVAVVGSREADVAGLELARGIGAALAGCGAWVVSGGAAGVDAAAHEGALRAGGRTLAVLGGGLDHIYPAANRGLLARMIESGGGILSECEDGQRPARWSFPRRNRIVAALGVATVVVRAGARSGALLTAAHAARLGQAVLVPAGVPGPGGEGLRQLVSGGAVEFDGVEDLLRVLGLAARAPATGAEPAALEGAAATLWGALDALPRGADEVARRAGVGAAAVLSGLAELELLGLVERKPGRGWVRRDVGLRGA